MDNLLSGGLAMLASPFMRQALVASFLASIACGVVGTLVVRSRLTFLAGGVAHAAYGGIGLAFCFGIPVLPATLAFSLAASMLMGSLSLRGKHSGDTAATDTAIGVLWAGGMAFGIILIELTPGYAGELMGFLFGSILTVPAADILAMAFFDAAILALLVWFYQGFWALCQDRDFAGTRAVPVNALYLLLVGITAVTVVLLIRIVGLILVLALLTIPPALAEKKGRPLYACMLAASLYSCIFCVIGLLVSWHLDISSGAAIIAVATCVYFLRPALRAVSR
ncbi:metal ABC transporter permease [Desulfovibrio sp. OttesenSCG-928-G15]|nr:metal ABC transporter permease [Desulfovibrio sp. OttesenSCG-928-G15]